MPLEQELIDLMLDEVTLELAVGKDKFNNIQYSDPVPVQCQVVRRNIQVISETGQETTSTVQIILADPTLPVTVDTRLTIDESWQVGSHPDIIQVLATKDDVGPYHLEIRA